MKYIGKSADTFKQTKGKRGLLIPAFKRIIPKTKTTDARFLDIACGNGDLYELAHEKGYKYYGLDISEYMINRAKNEYSNGNYYVSSATDFASKYKEKFDVVLISMLFTDLENKKDIYKTLSESKKVLKTNGIIVIGTVHPSFDRYMQAGILGRKGDRVDFRSYFSSGDKFFINHTFGDQPYVFEDHHWTLIDYMDCIKEAGLSIIDMDECPPDESVTGLDKAFFEERKKFPTYLVLICR